jgi:hypothetical protein
MPVDSRVRSAHSGRSGRERRNPPYGLVSTLSRPRDWGFRSMLLRRSSGREDSPSRTAVAIRASESFVMIASLQCAAQRASNQQPCSVRAAKDVPKGFGDYGRTRKAQTISATPSMRRRMPKTNGIARVAITGELNSRMPMRRLMTPRMNDPMPPPVKPRRARRDRGQGWPAGEPLRTADDSAPGYRRRCPRYR